MKIRNCFVPALFWLLLVAGMGITLHASPSLAQAQPPGWSKQDMDRFVDSVGDAVVRKLTEQNKIPPKAATVTEAPGEETANVVAAVAARLGDILRNVPGAIRHGIALPDHLDQSGKGGVGFWTFLFQLLGIAALGLGAEWLVRLVSVRPIARLVEGVSPPLHWSRWLAVTAFEALAIVVLYVVGHGAFAAIFHSGNMQDQLAGTLLSFLFSWRASIAIMRCWLRPNLAAARIAPLNHHDAAVILRAFAMVTAVSILSRSYITALTATGAARDEIVAQQFLNGPFVIGFFIATVLAVRLPFGHWLQGLVSKKQDGGLWLHDLMGKWHIAGVAFYLSLWMASNYGGISGRTNLPASLGLVQQVLIGWLLVETALHAIKARADGSQTDGVPQESSLGDIGWRALHILVRIAVAISLIRIVVTEILNLIPQSAWAGYSATMVSAGFVIFAAWAILQVSKFYFDRIAGPDRASLLPGAEEDDDEQAEGASRLKTLVPLMKMAVGIVVTGLTILIVLSQLGVNTTPLIAGASIFGLALSFGSQSLVRDIVSGIFYLADDAFRVGEYIDIGKAKGTVESFTLRSIRLRHQNGQIHTIPFGQLGQITNFSRDWATMKFNLRFARDTNIETLRKATKKIGVDLLADEELKDDFLLPLKMQGIADIQDNALIARFKFTVKPQRPSFIQRIAIKKMLEEFPQKGIEFASATVAVRSLDGLGSLSDAAAAAASRTSAPVVGA